MVRAIAYKKNIAKQFHICKTTAFLRTDKKDQITALLRNEKLVSQH
jgi:hypothetical protein